MSASICQDATEEGCEKRGQKEASGHCKLFLQQQNSQYLLL
jgi:hypothetical protein